MDNDTNLRNSYYLSQLNEMLVFFYFVIKYHLMKKMWNITKNIFQANIDYI